MKIISAHQPDTQHTIKITHTRPIQNRFSAWLLLLISFQPVIAHDLNSDAGFSGQLRLGYSRTEKFDSAAIGGKVGYVSPILYAFNASAVAYASYPIAGINDDELFLDSHGGPNGDGYAILGEAWLGAHFPSIDIKLGRQAFDTPYADSDDVGMIPNTFSGAVITHHGLPNTMITLAHLDKAAGVDSSKETFTEINGSSGVTLLGVNYEKDNWQAQLWHYAQPKATDMDYAEFSIEPSKPLKLGLQLAHQRRHGVSGHARLMGLSASYELEKIRLFTDYNKVWGAYGVNNAVGGVGGGPFFTSAEINTVDDVANIRAVAAGIEYTGIKNLSFGLRKIDFNQGVSDEIDFTLSYQLKKHFSADLIVSNLTQDGDNTRLFINYDF